MTIQNYFHRTILAFSLVLLVACGEDFLDNPPKGRLTSDAFPSTPNDALSAVFGAYNTLRTGNYHRGFFPIDDIMSDDASKGSNPQDGAATIGLFDNFTHNTTSGQILGWYRQLYVGIRRANVVINRVPTVNGLQQSLIDQYVAEARFLRALFYFDLARAYGGVPLIRSEQAQLELERASLEATYDFIESDLRAAIDGLSEKSSQSSSDLGRATRGAAAALLARTYLYQKNYDSAAFYALQVINSGEYSLEDEYRNTYAVAGEHGRESVFEIGAIVGDNVEQGGSEYARAQGVRGTPNRGFGFNRPTLNLIEAFDPSDPRMEETVIFLGETIDGILIEGDGGTPDETLDENGLVIEQETYNQKVWTPGENTAASLSNNRRLIRYAEVLLIAAEALNENSDPTSALTYLNQVRERAREGNDAILPDITDNSQTGVRQAILDERRFEFAMEGHRFWDLVRTGNAPAVLGPLGFQQGKHELLPIPQLERDLTQDRLAQNPGWE